MPEIGWAGLGIIPEVDADFGRKVGRGIDPSLSRVAHDSGKRFGGILGKAAVTTAAGVFGAGYAAFQIGKDALGEAREAQKIGRTSAAILKATGNAANLNRKEYDKLTESLMRKTAIDDEQITQGGNLLLTFKNVKREGKGLNDIFGRSLSSALDLSAAGFGSIDSASKMLGKALNDPVKGVSALGRAGVTFSEDQKKAIKSMVESNDLLGAQKLILREVESQVGGTAAKQKTSAKELEVAWGNVKEEIGFALIPVMEDLADVLLDKGIPAARNFSDWLTDDGIPAVKDFYEEVKPLAKEILPAAASAFDTIKGAGEKALPVVKGIVEAFNDMPDWAKDVAVLGAVGLGVGAKFKGKGGGGGLLGGGGGTSITNPAYVFVVNNGPGKDLPGGSPKGGLNLPGLFAALWGGKEVADGAREMFTGLRDPSGASGGSASEIEKALKKSDFGKYADELGINVGELAKGIALQGERSQEFKDAVKVLEKTNDGAWEDINDLIPVVGSWIQTSGDQAAYALRDLKKITEGIYTPRPGDKPGDPWAAMFGKDAAVGATLDKIPDAKLKVLQDPATVQTRDGVRDLLENVDGLTRKDYKVLFDILGLSKAKQEAATLLSLLTKIDKMMPTAGPGVGGSNINPFASRVSAADTYGGALSPFRIDKVEVRGSDSQRLIADLRDVARRQSIGGF